MLRAAPPLTCTDSTRALPEEVWDQRWEQGGRLVRWTLTLAALAVGAVVATVVVTRVDASVAAHRAQVQAATHPADPSAGASGSSPALELVRSWDERRARAWSSRDEQAVARLYARGASAAATDVAHLGRWNAQGWTLERTSPQLLAVTEVSRTSRRWVVDVTDRMTGVRARRGDDVVRLPDTSASTRRLEFVEVDGTWVVRSVTSVA